MSNLDIKCKFCDSILNKKKNVVDYENLSNTHGIFYDCESVIWRLILRNLKICIKSRKHKL